MEDLKKNYDALKATLTRTNIVVEWTELKTELTIEPTVKMQREAELNVIVKILGVGNEIKNMSPGQYALLGGAGRLIALNGTTYGIVKEHMIDMVFDTKPEISFDQGESQGEILTTATEQQIKRFAEKTKYPA